MDWLIYKIIICCLYLTYFITSHWTILIFRFLLTISLFLDSSFISLIIYLLYFASQHLLFQRIFFNINHFGFYRNLSFLFDFILYYFFFLFYFVKSFYCNIHPFTLWQFCFLQLLFHSIRVTFVLSIFLFCFFWLLT